MLLSESVSNGLSGGDDSLIASLIGTTVLLALNSVIAIVSALSRKVHSLLEGDPVLLGRDGQVLHNALKAQRVPEGDLRQALRAADCEQGLGAVQLHSGRDTAFKVDGVGSDVQSPEMLCAGGVRRDRTIWQ